MLYTLGNTWLVKTIVEEKIGFIGGHDYMEDCEKMGFKFKNVILAGG